MSSEIRPVTPEKLGDHTLQSKAMEAKGLVERRALQPLRFPKLEILHVVSYRSLEIVKLIGLFSCFRVLLLLIESGSCWLS